MIEIDDPGRRRESRLRVRVRRYRLAMHKSRDRTLHAGNAGGFMLVYTRCNAVMWGENYNLSLDDVETILADLALKQNVTTKGKAAPAPRAAR